MRTRCQYHCSGCDQHFTSLSAFDSHRRGEGDDRHCVDALDDDRFHLKTDAGTCDMRKYRTGVRLWQLKADVEALARSGFGRSRDGSGSVGGSEPETARAESLN